MAVIRPVVGLMGSAEPTQDWRAVVQTATEQAVELLRSFADLEPHHVAEPLIVRLQGAPERSGSRSLVRFASQLRREGELVMAFTRIRRDPERPSKHAGAARSYSTDTGVAVVNDRALTWERVFAGRPASSPGGRALRERLVWWWRHLVFHELLHLLGLPHAERDPTGPCAELTPTCYSVDAFEDWRQGKRPNYGLLPHEQRLLNAHPGLRPAGRSDQMVKTAIPNDLVTPHAVIHVPAHPANRFGGSTRSGWYRPRTRARALVLHTPEEDVDDVESTPHYFARELEEGRRASTDAYADSDGDLYVMVADEHVPYANGVADWNRAWKGVGGGHPPWDEDGISLNVITRSIEIEGRAATMHRTFKVGGAQYRTVVAWCAFWCEHDDIPADRDHIVGHEELASNKRDPGLEVGFPMDALVSDVRRALAPPMSKAIGRQKLAYRLWANKTALHVAQPQTELGEDRYLVTLPRKGT